MSRAESIEVVLGRVVQRLILAQGAAAADTPVDLTGFEREVEAACRHIAEAPAEEARACLPSLRALLRALDSLAESLAARAATQAPPAAAAAGPATD